MNGAVELLEKNGIDGKYASYLEFLPHAMSKMLDKISVRDALEKYFPDRLTDSNTSLVKCISPKDNSTEPTMDISDDKMCECSSCGKRFNIMDMVEIYYGDEKRNYKSTMSHLIVDFDLDLNELTNIHDVKKRVERDETIEYNRTNRFKSITEYFKENDDFDSCDLEFDIIVTCVEPLYSENNYEEKFTKYIYDNVNVLYEAQENYNTVCDWSGFVNDNFKTLKNFSEKHWANPSIYYDDKGNVDNDEFLYHWVNEINLYLAGYANEEQYKMLYKALAGEEKTATLESKTDIER